MTTFLGAIISHLEEEAVHDVHLPLADVVWADPAADDLVVRLLLGPDGPALVVLVHYHLLLLLDVQTANERKVYSQTGSTGFEPEMQLIRQQPVSTL